MAQTSIEWTMKVWNPTTGCDKVSQGCKFCYAEGMHKRLRAMGQPKYKHEFLGGAQPYEADLLKPLSWRKPTTIFVNSMSDLFHKDIPFEYIDMVFAVMKATPQHTYQVLTKRIDRALEYWNSKDLFKRLDAAYLKVMDKASPEGIHVISAAAYEQKNEIYGWPMRNLWMGTSVENQEAADARIPFLIQIPAHVRFLSCEPLLGPVNFSDWTYPKELVGMPVENYEGSESSNLKQGIDWLIAGGESGHHARPMHPDWARSLRDQCEDAGIPFFFKQWGGWREGFIGGTPIKNMAMVCNDGSIIIGKDAIPGGKRASLMSKVGKKEAGRMLDGLEHSQYPNS